jgi:hypothetical protein
MTSARCWSSCSLLCSPRAADPRLRSRSGPRSGSGSHRQPGSQRQRRVACGRAARRHHRGERYRLRDQWHDDHRWRRGRRHELERHRDRGCRGRGTPNAWQDIEVVTDDGTASFPDFFVGVEYTGTAANLQAFLDDLVPGTAVLLQAQTYDLSADAGRIHRRQPRAVRAWRSPDDDHGSHGTGVVVLADFGEEVTLADMTIEVDNIIFFHGSLTETLGCGFDLRLARRWLRPRVRTLLRRQRLAPGGPGTSRGRGRFRLHTHDVVSAEVSLARFADAFDGVLCRWMRSAWRASPSSSRR